MFASWEAGVGLDIIIWLQSFENPVFNALAQAFAVLGGDTGYLILLPLIYWSIDKRLGRWLLVVLTLSLFVIIGAKELFERPRPFIFAPDEVSLLISEASGFGFPSGHVGLTAAVWGFVALWARRRWGYVLLVVYLVLMAWSRMYGGVHYPQDVIGGLIAGSAVAVGLYAGRDALANLWSRIPTVGTALVVIVGGIVMAWLLVDDEAGVSGAGILVGGGLGVLFESLRVHFDGAGTTMQRGLRFLAGMVLTLAVFVALDLAFEALSPEPVFRVIRYGVVTLVILGLYPWLMVRAGLTGTEPQS
jgi:membrane-associated phospholipid phosphatase